MATLITGSLAYDNIMAFHGRFREHILPEQVHILNVSFLVPTMRREFGGCAGNIGYGLKLLGGEPLVMGTLGEIDAQRYLDRFKSLGIRLDHVRVLPDMYTAQAMITTDLDNNQIAAFHPGAMMQAHINQVRDAQGVTLGIVAPDGADAMRQHAEQFAEGNIPFIFDPGQGLPILSGPELRRMIELATYVAVNDYEAKLLSDKTGWSFADIVSRVEATFVTLGAEGAQIHHSNRVESIPAVAPAEIVDPTGCGDAFRAGLLHGITTGLDWATTGRLASLMGSVKIVHQGPQTYKLTRSDIDAKFEAAFGYSLK